MNPGRVVMAVMPALAAMMPAACRKTERLAPRSEELGPESSWVPMAPAARPRLSAPGRGEPERVEFITADGVTIVGDFFCAEGLGAPPLPGPRGQCGVFPAVLLVHGKRGSRLDWQPLLDRILPTPRALPSVLAIDLRGHGDSTTAAGGVRLDARRLQDVPAAGPNSWGGVVADVAAAMEWLRDAGGGAKGRVVVVGAGIGAVAAIRGAADAGGGLGVAGVVALSPTEIHGVTLGAGATAKLAAAGARFLAAAAEDDPAPAPAGVRAIEASAGVENVVAEVFETGGHGVALLRGRPDLADAALAFATRLLASSERVAIPVGDEIVLVGSLDPALDPSAPAIVLVHGLRRDSRSLEPLRAALATALPCRILAVDLRAHGASVATSSGSPIGFEQLSGGVPDEDVRSYRGLLRDVEAVVRFATNTGDVDCGQSRARCPRYAIVGAGFGGTLAVVAAAAATADPGVGPPAAIVLLSPVANMHGLSIWEPLGARLGSAGAQVFAAASSRASMSLDDAAEGIGSDARTVRTISTMLGPGASVRIYPSDAYAEDLQAAHRDLVPAIVEFLRTSIRLK